MVRIREYFHISTVLYLYFRLENYMFQNITTYTHTSYKLVLIWIWYVILRLDIIMDVEKNYLTSCYTLYISACVYIICASGNFVIDYIIDIVHNFQVILYPLEFRKSEEFRFRVMYFFWGSNLHTKLKCHCPLSFCIIRRQ